MREADRRSAVTDGGSNPLDRTVAGVSRAEDAGHRGLEKNRARFMASGRDGEYRPVSMALMVWRETPIAPANSPCDIPFAARTSRTAFLMVES